VAAARLTNNMPSKVEVELVADVHDSCGEGPSWDARQSVLRWVDITGKRFHCLDWPRKTPVRTIEPGFEISAFALTNNEHLVVAGSDGVWLWDQQHERIPLVQEHEGERLAINDALADVNGRLLAGSTFFDPSNEHYTCGKLYSIAADGKVSVLDDGIKLANGLGFSPDNRTLYFTDSADRVIYAYDYDPEAGQASNRRVYVTVPSTEGLPDGLTVDAEGFVWSAQWFGGCICRYDPDGSLERRIPIPAGQTSSLVFGGPDLTDIFVTTAGTPDALSLAPPDYQASGEAVGGALFRLNVGIQGKEDFRCQVEV